MLNRNGDGLIIFDQFVVLKEEMTRGTNSKFSVSSSNIVFTEDFDEEIDSDSNFVITTRKKLNSYKNNTLSKFKNLFKKSKKEEINYIDIEDFFHDVKLSKNELENIDERLNSVKNIIFKAKKTHQQALLEKLEKYIYAIKKESILYATNNKIYIEEKTIVDFYKKVLKNKKNNLKLTWIKNYINDIPDELVIKIKQFDEKKIFDNYVILHFDPKNLQSELTEADRQEIKKRDPILFGVIDGIRRLYYIGDWIDEYCDLTFEKMIDNVGKKSVKYIEKDVKLGDF